MYRSVLTRSFSKGAATVRSDGYVFISLMQRPLHSITLIAGIYVQVSRRLTATLRSMEKVLYASVRVKKVDALLTFTGETMGKHWLRLLRGGQGSILG